MIDWKVCETELEESIKKVLTWSHLIDLPTGVRGGGVQTAGGEDEEDGKKDKKKKEKEGGGKLVTRRPKRGRNPPVACGALFLFAMAFLG